MRWVVLVFLSVAVSSFADGIGVGTQITYPTQWSQPKVGPNGMITPSVPTRFETREVGTGFYPQPIAGPASTPVKPPPQLVVAADKGDLKTVRALLEKRVNINEATADGATALMASAARGNLELVQLLVDKGADLNEVTSGGKTALIYAANNGHTKVVQFLLAHNADRRVLDMAGKMAIDYAAANKHADVVALLSPATKNPAP